MQREGGEVFKDLGLILKSPSLSFLHSIRLSPPLVLHCRRVCHATWDGQILDGHTRVLHLFSDSVLTDSNNVDACPHNTNTHQYPRPTPSGSWAPETLKKWLWWKILNGAACVWALQKPFCSLCKAVSCCFFSLWSFCPSQTVAVQNRNTLVSNAVLCGLST